MAMNISGRKGNVKNIRSHALNATKKDKTLIYKFINLKMVQR